MIMWRVRLKTGVDTLASYPIGFKPPRLGVGLFWLLKQKVPSLPQAVHVISLLKGGFRCEEKLICRQCPSPWRRYGRGYWCASAHAR